MSFDGTNQWLFIRTLVEEVIEEQRLEVLVLLVSGSDVTKEHTLTKI
jgi:hypothetical protein